MQERVIKSKKKRSNQTLRRTAGPARRIAVIGVGRLGAVLGRALGRAGHRIEVVVARSAAKARKGALSMQTDALSLTSTQLDRLSVEQSNRLTGTNLILIATPDDAIGTVGEQLAAAFEAAPQTKAARVALHASGALSSEILKPLREAGFAIGSLHPLVSISDPLSTAELFSHAFFCVEGDRAAVRLARAIVRDLGAQSFTIDARAKALYHAAAVTSSGHAVALFDIALEMLNRCGLSPHRAQQVLLPLVRSTLTSLSNKNPQQALTGTFSRADLLTVRRHLAAIESEGLSDALAAYLLLGKRSIQLARKVGKNQLELDQLERLIDEAAQLEPKS